jgi:hypothetical protein
MEFPIAEWPEIFANSRGRVEFSSGSEAVSGSRDQSRRPQTRENLANA